MEDPERFCRSGVKAIRRNSNIEYRNSKQIRNPNSQMFETRKRQMGTIRRQPKRCMDVLEVFGFGAFEFVSDFVLRI
jgi:hypothetical protein